ncbi:MAG: CRISPR-associated endonuclease Cas2 [Thermoanaerobaculia bacterium]|nr:CRISPR-associated endonuclease Cas2 [Thermoanaerobaculia bacterium]
MRYVIAYDVSDDKIRLAISEVLEGFGTRVQKSVFECELVGDGLEVLTGMLRLALESPKNGQVRFARTDMERRAGDQPALEPPAHGGRHGNRPSENNTTKTKSKVETKTVMKIGRTDGAASRGRGSRPRCPARPDARRAGARAAGRPRADRGPGRRGRPGSLPAHARADDQ